VVPTTLVGVLVFVASVGPGYVYVKVAERWRPYVERTALREAAEIIVTGSIATSVGVLVALMFGKLLSFLDVTALSNQTGQYVVRHPGHASLGVLVVLVVSYGLAWLVAANMPGRGARVYPDSAWYAMLERRLPAEHAIVATVELRDGRRITGLVRSFTAEQTPVDDREITLGRSEIDSMKVLLPQAEQPTDLGDDFIILRGGDIANLAARYVPLQPPAPTAPNPINS
jgi:Family of unknown function (DUF6338)